MPGPFIFIATNRLKPGKLWGWCRSILTLTHLSSIWERSGSGPLARMKRLSTARQASRFSERPPTPSLKC